MTQISDDAEGRRRPYHILTGVVVLGLTMFLSTILVAWVRTW